MNAQRFVSQFDGLPAPSPVVVKLVGVLNNQDADSDQVLKLLKCDGILCGKLLAACNSAAMGLSQRVGSVEQALFHLGYQKVYRLVLSLSFGSTLGASLPGYSIEDQELWRHALVTAMIAEASQADDCPVMMEPSVAYTAGLLHDIGKVILNSHLDPVCIAEIGRLIESEHHSRIEAERTVIGSDHAEVGACLLESWRLPETIVEAVAHHHEPVSKPVPLGSTVIHFADMLAIEIGSAPGWHSHAVRADEDAMNALKLEPDRVDRLMIAAHGSLRKVEEMVTVPNSPKLRQLAEAFCWLLLFQGASDAILSSVSLC